MGDRLIVLVEPHFVYCLDKATGKVLWQRECNVLELTAPDKLDECRRLWTEYVAARAALMKLGCDGVEREAVQPAQVAGPGIDHRANAPLPYPPGQRRAGARGVCGERPAAADRERQAAFPAILKHR
jgi:hypothetical protein